MTDIFKENENLIHMNSKLCMLLGFAYGLLERSSAYTDKESHEWLDCEINKLFKDNS